VKISILTPSYNQGKYIEENILSVLNQNYPNFEHIIIDGGSTDNTVEILKKYPHLKWVSEPDQGQADALNKGLKMATGEIIGWINSDDYYLDNVFFDVNSIFSKNHDVKWIIGNIVRYFEIIDKFFFERSPLIHYERLISNPNIVRQQAAFFKREILLSVGGLNKDFFCVMDYDLWLRLSKISSPLMIDKNWAVFRIHPYQKSTYKYFNLQIKEINTILERDKPSKVIKNKIILKKYFYFIKASLKQFLIKIRLIDNKYYNIPLSMKDNKTI